MGKKRKKRKKNKTLTRQQFIAKFCSKCDVCIGPSDATFCYDVMYIPTPSGFIAHCWPYLRSALEWPMTSIAQSAFLEDAFCRTGGCDVMDNPFDYRCTCPHVEGCVEAFDIQVNGSSSIYYAQNYYCDDVGKEHTHPNLDHNFPYAKAVCRKGNKTKKQKEPPPTATFFSNGDKAWKEVMKKALNGNTGI